MRGALPVALAARAAGVDALVLPRENLPEAGVVSGIRVLGAASLAELGDFLDRRAELPAADVDVTRLFEERQAADVDFAEVKGQAHAKRALEVAAAGGRNIVIMLCPDPDPCEAEHAHLHRRSEGRSGYFLVSAAVLILASNPDSQTAVVPHSSVTV